MDGLTSQNMMSVDGEEFIPGKALEKRWCSSLFLKAGRDSSIIYSHIIYIYIYI